MDVIEVSPAGGNFKDLRSRHLLLFDKAEHRHDRGWTHAPRGEEDKPPRAKKRWRTAGIVHFAAQADEEH